MKHSRNAVHCLTFAAMSAALIAVTTAYLLHLHIPITGGHTCVHLGDAIIFLSASVLPTGYACAAAAIGGALADLLCGSPVWIPWTFVIKALVACLFTEKGSTLLAKRNLIALPIACIITIFGYYCAEGFVYGNWLSPLYSVIANVLQGIASSGLYIVIALILDKVQIKKQLHF